MFNISAHHGLVIIGQSNERGRRWSVTTGTTVGARQMISRGMQCSDPIPPKGRTAGPDVGYNGSWWPYALQSVYDTTGIFTTVSNTAVGATSIIRDWCSDTVGDGTGTPYAHTDGVNWDQNGYFADTLAAAQAGVFDQVWVAISFGQSDSLLDVSLANYQLAHQNAIDYFLSNGVNVMLGLSCLVVSKETWYSTKGSPAIDNLLDIYSANAKVKPGANLYSLWGASLETYDAFHLTMEGYDLASTSWSSAIIAAWT